MLSFVESGVISLLYVPVWTVVMWIMHTFVYVYVDGYICYMFFITYAYVIKVLIGMLIFVFHI